MNWKLFNPAAGKHRVMVQTILVALVSYTSGVIVNLVTSLHKDFAFWILLGAGLVVVVLMSLLSAAVSWRVHESDRAREREHSVHRTGYQTLSREISTLTGIVRNWPSENQSPGTIPTRMMERAVRELHSTVEAEYGIGVSVSEHIEFEVTFMTKSLRDNKLTIAAWANRDGRAPKSLALRGANPELYSGTESSKLYDDANRTPRIITSTVGPDYKEVYAGQKTRIRSSIVYPVFDDQSSLVGTLVVHCDQDGFFKPAALKLWRELLEPYTKRLALAGALVQALNPSGGQLELY
ncbi:MAG: hypothetical protein WDM85_13645 [Caulobacteraceae bacterium]